MLRRDWVLRAVRDGKNDAAIAKLVPRKANFLVERQEYLVNHLWPRMANNGAIAVADVAVLEAAWLKGAGINQGT